MRSGISTYVLVILLISAVSCSSKKRSDLSNDEIAQQLGAFNIDPGTTEIPLDSIFNTKVLIKRIEAPEHLECEVDTNFGVLRIELIGDSWPPISLVQIHTQRGIYDIALAGPTDLQQVFMIQDRGYGQVFVVGTFTDWKKQEMYPTHGGQWVLELKMEPERYLDHFLADGKAFRDSTNPEYYEDGYPEYSVLDLRVDQSSKSRIVQTDTTIETRCATCMSVIYLADNCKMEAVQVNDSVWSLDKKLIPIKSDTTDLVIHANGKFRSSELRFRPGDPT